MLETLVSIHDVMPSTLPYVERLERLASASGVTRLILLVVPGHAWTASQLDCLRRWQDQGYILAGHGWMHRCERIASWYHRLHSLVISRDVAEHLAESPQGRVELMQRCADWFERHALGIPTLYVPPAWALGRMSLAMLRQTPFRLIETQTGLLDVRSGRTTLLPLLGFESDTTSRTVCLRGLNAANRLLAHLLGRPLRISLHPCDLHLRLESDLRAMLSRRQHPITYDEFLCRNRVTTTIVSARSR